MMMKKKTNDSSTSGASVAGGLDSAAMYALKFWNSLCDAARQDGRTYDPVWENTTSTTSETSSSSMFSSSSSTHSSSSSSNEADFVLVNTPNNDSLLYAATNIVLTESSDKDQVLLDQFQLHMGDTFSVKVVDQEILSSPLWEPLLNQHSTNFHETNVPTVLRQDAYNVAWMKTTTTTTPAASGDDTNDSAGGGGAGGVMVVPRIQFLYIEIARIRGGVYATKTFRQKLQGWDMKCHNDDLSQALTIMENNKNKNEQGNLMEATEKAALLAIEKLQLHWPYPRSSLMKQTGVLVTVQKGWKSGSTPAIQNACHNLLLYWKDMVDLGKLASSTKQLAALERAARALASDQQQPQHQNRTQLSKKIHESTTSTTSSHTKGSHQRDVLTLSLSRLYELVSGRKHKMGETSYGHPHYTTRFDLLVANLPDERKRLENMNAILTFCTSAQQDNMAFAFIDILRSPQSLRRKRVGLDEAKRTRERIEVEDVASPATDASDIKLLYELTSTLILKESWSLSKLGFSDDQDGLCILLATLKAFALRETSKVKLTNLEEAFTSWWHAGVDRFQFSRVVMPTTDPQELRPEATAPRVIVVFSSIGSSESPGLTRPEWEVSLSALAPSESLDVLYVMDPAFSWYCQDPTCQWQGGEYYCNELKKRLKKYEAVMFLGYGMGGAAALRFSELANAVLVFSPRVDISYNKAVSRMDFTSEQRQQFEMDLVHACRETKARVLIHYSEQCEDDQKAVMMLPERRALKFERHDTDGRSLESYLREEAMLQILITEAVSAFSCATFRVPAPPPRPHPSDNSFRARASRWLPKGNLFGAFRFNQQQQDTTPSYHKSEHSTPVYEAQLDIAMLPDGSFVVLQEGEVVLQDGEEQVEFTELD